MCVCEIPEVKGQGRFSHPWSFLDDLLVSSLDAAVPLKQVDDVPVLVPEHLHLHVPGEVCEGGGGLERTSTATTTATAAAIRTHTFS